MEYHIVLLKAVVATGAVFEAHWTLDHTDGDISVQRSSAITLPEDPPLLYEGLTEEVAVQAVKDALGTEYIAALEQGMLDDIAAKQNAAVIEGLPWAVA